MIEPKLGRYYVNLNGSRRVRWLVYLSVGRRWTACIGRDMTKDNAERLRHKFRRKFEGLDRRLLEGMGAGIMDAMGWAPVAWADA